MALRHRTSALIVTRGGRFCFFSRPRKKGEPQGSPLFLSPQGRSHAPVAAIFLTAKVVEEDVLVFNT